MIGLGKGGEMLAVGRVFVSKAVKAEAVFAEEFGGDVFGVKVAGFKIFAGEFEKTGEIKCIIINSAARTATLNFDMFEKIRNEFGDIHEAIITLML